MPPKVSVGLPVYNGQKYLPNALTRLLEQDFEDFELIISDNASTDATEAICREFAARDRRVRYHRNAVNVGLAANHNQAFSLARGQFFKWSAYDDDFPRPMLARFVSALEKAPSDVILVYSPCEYIDESGQVTGVDSDHRRDDPSAHKRLSHLLRNLNAFNSLYGLIRTEALRKTRLLGLFPMSDHVLLSELSMLGRFLQIPEPVLRIRRHAGRSFTANRSARALRELFNPGQKWLLPLGVRTRMNLELVRAALQVPVGAKDTLLCTAVVPWEILRAFGSRQKRTLSALLTREPRVSHGDVTGSR
jgi:glycosyltransferase involved in cell wall biosynthesis